MTDEEDPGPLAQKLRKLWQATVNPQTGKPYSYEAIAKSICEAHDDPRAISASYIGRLMNSRRDDPGVKRLGLLAEWFGVPLSHLLDAEQWTDEDLELLLAARRSPQIRSIAFRAEKLSDSSRAAVEAILKHMEAADDRLQSRDDAET
ncbi:helix-turn-helix domain-containing protein (plasmid) [Pseudonocardia sp. DSM 110487]|uniref:helix-turn-helix domain-containing protein n=1 Tax=Pseudonocardia sp. DSM 110487 TaxID=2865833 RepID=UPI001C69D89C|nr:helix-turn-helix domain-containing protein [Pseudonocardia sp. DSM 110487]QYN41068.1 helix-turn-helix domain-containing protein [Pseudonocardia sp. DSM 110487]